MWINLWYPRNYRVLLPRQRVAGYANMSSSVTGQISVATEHLDSPYGFLNDTWNFPQSFRGQFSRSGRDEVDLRYQCSGEDNGLLVTRIDMGISPDGFARVLHLSHQIEIDLLWQTCI